MRKPARSLHQHDRRCNARSAELRAGSSDDTTVAGPCKATILLSPCSLSATYPSLTQSVAQPTRASRCDRKRSSGTLLCTCSLSPYTSSSQRRILPRRCASRCVKGMRPCAQRGPSLVVPFRLVSHAPLARRTLTAPIPLRIRGFFKSNPASRRRVPDMVRPNPCALLSQQLAPCHPPLTKVDRISDAYSAKQMSKLPLISFALRH